MERNRERHVQTPMQDRFLLHDICGTWVSASGSPDIEIFRDGRRFRLMLKYKLGAAFTFRLKQNREHAFFHFYGFVQVSYNQEKDLLTLSTEGNYSRVYEI